MSRQVDERVVEMRFDNRHFESNVKTTMSTLDRLKQSLHLKGAEKGLENIDAAAKKVDMTHLGKGIESVQAKFSALQVVGVTALANITNSAINAGKNLVKSLSIDQITAGMSKYEQKTASVQTIMNATGKSISEVNSYLEKLMWFSDETSYGFTDMTAALGQMTSSGGDIEKLIPLITGVANATAYAGKGAAEFSRVMYNLNQSYGAGYLQLMDWKSLELAGVGSKQLKQTLIDTAVELGKIEEGQVNIANFAETLKDKWADTEVMEGAFGKFGEFSEAVHAMVQSGEVDTASEAIEKLSGKYGDVAEKAFKSAQEAKSFTEAIDATKDAVSSGWMRTFEIIFGNYEQAKVLWTDLANSLWDLFASGGESRNEWLEEALSYSPLEKFSEKIKSVTDSIQAPIKKLEEYNDVVNRIIRGDFGNGQVRFEKLAEAGYDWAHAQNLVNEKLGNSHRYTTKLTNAQKEQTSQITKLSDAKLKEAGLTEEEIKLYRELENEAEKTGKTIDELISSMEQKDGRTLLIDSFKNIGSGLVGIINGVKEAFSEIFPPMTAMQLYKLIEGFNKLTSKLRLTDSETGELNENGEKLKRTFKGLFAALDIILTIVGGPIKIAFKVLKQLLSVFDVDILDVTASIGDAIVGFRDWIDSVLDFTEIFEKIKPALTGFIDSIRDWVNNFKTSFADIGSNIIAGLKNGLSGGFKSVWDAIINFGKKILDTIKKVLGINSPSTETFEIGKNLIQGLINGLGAGASAIFDVVKNIGSTIIDSFENMDWKVITSWLKTIVAFFPQLKILNQLSVLTSHFATIGGDTVEGLVGGLKGGISKVAGVVLEIGKNIINTIKNVLGIHSPSTVMFTIGKFLISGLIFGLAAYKTGLLDNIKDICVSIFTFVKDGIGKVVNWIKSLNVPPIKWEHILAVATLVGVVATLKKTLGIMESFGKGIEGIGKGVESFGKLANTLNDRITGAVRKKGKLDTVADSVLKFAAAIVILAGALYILSKIESDRIWDAVKALAAVAGIVVVLAGAAKLLGGVDGSLGKLAFTLVGVALAMGIIAKVMKSFQFLTSDNIGPIRDGLLLVGGVLAAFMLISKIPVDTKGLFSTLIGISVAMLVMVRVMKSIGAMDETTLKKGYDFIAGFALIVGAFMLITKIDGGGVSSLGGMFTGIALALLSMVAVVKLMGTMDPNEIKQGYQCIWAFTLVIGALMLINKIPGSGSSKLMGTLTGVSVAMLAMAACVKILAGLNEDALNRAGWWIIGFGVLIGVLMGVAKIPGNTTGLTSTLLGISVAIAVLAGIAVVLSLVSDDGLKKGIGAVLALGTIMAVLIGVTKNAQKCAGTIWAITAAIGVLAAVIYILSKHNDPDALKGAAATIGILMSIMGGVLWLAGKSSGAAGKLAAMSLVIATLAGALYLIAQLPTDTALPAAIALGVVMLALSGAMVIISKVGNISINTVAALGVMTLALGVLAGALWLIVGLPVDKVLPSALALSTLMLALSGAMVIISAVGNISTNTVAALGIMTVALGILSGALWLISGMPIANALVGALALSTLMLALSASMVIISGVGGSALAGAAALLAIAGALAILTPCIQQLGSMSLAEIGKGLLALAGAFAVLGVAGLVLGPIAPAILMLAGAITLIGVGCLAAGAGFQMFTTALTQFMMTALMLQGQGPAIAAGITAIITGICTAIVNSVTAITSAITAVVLAITQALITSVPAILNCLGVMITSFLAFLVSAVPQFVTAGMKIIKGILQGIADNIGGIIKAATDIIVNFLDGIAAGLPRIIDSGIKLMISFINGMADGIRNNTPAVINATNNLMDAIMGAIKAWFSNAVSRGSELVGKLISGVKTKFSEFKTVGKNLVDGFIQGVKDKFTNIKDTAVNAVSGAVDAVKNFLGIHSPSRVFAEIGGYSGEGFVGGLKAFGGKAADTAKNVGASALNGIKSVFSSKAATTEVGKQAVAGIANGIKSDMSAEEAAKKKAQNIADAFKKELDKADLRMNIVDEEHSLWKTLNENSASELDKLETEIAALNKKLPEQQGKVKLAQEEYDITKENFGENSEEALSAYKKLVKEQTEAAKLTNQISENYKKIAENQEDLIDLNNESIELEHELWETSNDSTASEAQKLIAERSMLEKKIANQYSKIALAESQYQKAVENGESAEKLQEYYNNILQAKIDLGNLVKESTEVTESLDTTQADAARAYNDWLQENYEVLSQFGKTREEIQELARKATGFDPNEFYKALNDQTAGSGLVSAFGDLGAQYGQSLGDAAKAGAKEVVESTAQTLAGCVESVKGQKQQWYECGTTLMQGLIDGIKDQTTAIQEAIVGSLNDAIEQAKYSIANGALSHINPVINLSDIQNGIQNLSGSFGADRSYALAGANADYFANQNSLLSDIVDKMNRNSSENTKIVNAIGELRGDFGKLSKAISDIEIRMDSGALVGEILSKIDAGLGQTARHKGRGN